MPRGRRGDLGSAAALSSAPALRHAKLAEEETVRQEGSSEMNQVPPPPCFQAAPSTVSPQESVDFPEFWEWCFSSLGSDVFD